MMFLLIPLALVSLLALAATIRDVKRDGYGPIPTRPDGRDRLTRYR